MSLYVVPHYNCVRRQIRQTTLLRVIFFFLSTTIIIVLRTFTRVSSPLKYRARSPNTWHGRLLHCTCAARKTTAIIRHRYFYKLQLLAASAAIHCAYTTRIICTLSHTVYTIYLLHTPHRLTCNIHDDHTIQSKYLSDLLRTAHARVVMYTSIL